MLLPLLFILILFICDKRKIALSPSFFMVAALAFLSTIRIPETRTDIISLFITIHFLFACLYVAAYKIDSHSFKGVRSSNNDAEYQNMLLIFDMIYFSMVTFFTVGYGDISPVTKLVRSLAMAEMVTAYGMTAAILIKLFDD